MITSRSFPILEPNAHVTSRDLGPAVEMRMSVSRSSSQLDHTHTKDLLTIIKRCKNCSRMTIFPGHQVWPRPSYKTQRNV